MINPSKIMVFGVTLSLRWHSLYVGRVSLGSFSKQEEPGEGRRRGMGGGAVCSMGSGPRVTGVGMRVYPFAAQSGPRVTAVGMRV